MSVKIWNVQTGEKFLGNQITNIKITTQIDPLSITLPSGSADISLRVVDGEPEFSENDLILIYFNDDVCWGGRVSEIKQTEKNTFVISLFDLPEFLEKFEFVGDVYTDKNVLELAKEILTSAGISASVYSSGMDEQTISGYIPYTNCREALSQLLFAAGWYIRRTTLGSAFQFAKYDSSYQIKQIEKARTLTGGNIKKQSVSGGVELTIYDYHENEDGYPTRIYWKSAEKGEATGVRIPLDQPGYGFDYHKTTNSSTYEILVESANLIIANYEMHDLDGNPSRWQFDYKLYEADTQQLARYSDSLSGNIYVIQNKTLVNPNNSTEIIERCFEYYSKNNEATAKIVIGKHVSEDGTVTYDEDVSCGDVVTIPTDYQGTYTGRIIKEQYNLNGNIIIKEITVR